MKTIRNYAWFAVGLNLLPLIFNAEIGHIGILIIYYTFAIIPTLIILSIFLPTIEKSRYANSEVRKARITLLLAIAILGFIYAS